MNEEAALSLEEEISLVATEEQRLDVFAATAADISRARAQALIEQGLVTVNGVLAPKRTKLKAGDRVTVLLPPPEDIEAKPQNIPIEIVYEDSDLLVVNKPQGMVVHPAAGSPDGTLVNALLYHLKGQLSSINGKLRPGIVHRIDKDTAGLLMVAKNDKAHISLAEQIAAHSFTRCYEAVVRGCPKEESGTVNAPIGRHRTDRKRMAVVTGGRDAVTHYKLIKAYRGFSHLRLQLETGRTHQIRVHMAHIGHPVAGDPVYGGAELAGLTGQCLFAKHIGFKHPTDGRWLEFEAELPQFFTKTLNYLDKISG